MQRVLIVDDEPNIRRMVGALLAAEGYEVREAADGAAGVRAVEEEEPDVALIDLNQMAGKFYEALGEEGSKAAFLHYPAGTYPNRPEELKDNTHFNSYGGYELAKLVAQGIKEAKLPLAEQLVEELPATNTDPSKQPVGLNFDYLKAK